MSVQVTKEWYEKASLYLHHHQTECPFCGSNNLTTKEANKWFYSYRGCLDCCKWIDPVVSK